MMLHPRFSTLNRFSDGDLDSRARARVAEHLAACTRCRAVVQSIRDISEQAPKVMLETPDPSLLNKILERRARGDRVIIPLADPEPRRVTSPHLLGAAAAVLAIAIGLWFVVLPMQPLSADHSELVLAPERPTIGSTIQVDYRPSGMLANNNRLVLRARFRRPNDRTYRWTTHQVDAAVLERGRGGVFSGSFQLPDSTVYAVFAVEDTLGERLDSNGEALWELHTYDGERPSYASLQQRYAELMGRNWGEAARNAELTAELYPERIESWYMLSAFQRWVPGGRGQDSVLAIIENRADSLHMRFANDSTLSADDVALMYWTAFTDSRDSSIADFWWRRLSDEAPSHPTRVQHLVRLVGQEFPDDPEARLTRLEEIWNEYGAAREDLPMAAYYAASKLGNTRAMQVWKPRVEAMRPWPQWTIVSDFVRYSELREIGMNHIRELIARLDTERERDRYLFETVDLHRVRQDSALRLYFATLGNALIAAGETEAGIDTLDLALATGWDADVFRTAADAKLELGDSAGAIQLLSWIAADPTTDYPTLSQVNSAALAMVDPARWESLKVEGRTEMWQRLLADVATQTTFLDDPSVIDNDGEPASMRQLADGRVLLVVLWHYLCGPPGEQTLLQVDSLRKRWLGIDAEVIVVTDGSSNEEMRAFIEATGLDVRLYHDAYGDVRQSFDWWSVPSHVVIDNEFRMRFKGDFKPSVRVVEALVARNLDIESGTVLVAPQE